MAELIDKGALYGAMTEEYKKHYAGTGKGYDFTIAMQMVQNQPTTTEAEIKARVYEEAVRKLYNLCYLQTWVKEKDLEQLADQLKEE